MLNLLLAIASSALVSITMRLSERSIKNNTAMLAVNYIMCTFLAWAYTGFGSLYPAAVGGPLAAILGGINGILYLAGFVLLQRNIRVNGVVLSATFIKLGQLISTRPDIFPAAWFAAISAAEPARAIRSLFRAISFSRLESILSKTSVTGFPNHSAKAGVVYMAKHWA